MAAASVATQPIHSLLQSLSSYDLRKCINNQATSLLQQPVAPTVIPGGAHDVPRRGSDGPVLVSRKEQNQDITLVKPQDVPQDLELGIILSVHPGMTPLEAQTETLFETAEQDLRLLRERLQDTEDEMKRLRVSDSKVALEQQKEALQKEREALQKEREALQKGRVALQKEKETLQKDSDSRTAERQFLIEAVRCMRQLYENAEQEAEESLARVQLLLSAKELPSENAVADGLQSARVEKCQQLLRKESAAASSRRHRHAVQVASLSSRAPSDASELGWIFKADNHSRSGGEEASLESVAADDDDAAKPGKSDAASEPHAAVLLPRENRDAPEVTRAAEEELPSAVSASSAPEGSLVLEEYLKAYRLVYGFKEIVSRILKGRDGSNGLDDLEPIVCDDDNVPTVDAIKAMTADMGKVLKAACTAVDGVLSSDPAGEPILPSNSTIKTHIIPSASDEHEKDDGADAALSPAAESEMIAGLHEAQINSLQQQVTNMQMEQRINRAIQNDDIRSNAMLISAVQGHVDNLHTRLTAEGAGSRALSIPSQTSHRKETSVMFTRLDAERNTKILKRALSQHKVGFERATEAIDKMDAYLGLPQQRLIELTKKYVHQKSVRSATGAHHNGHQLQPQEQELLKKMEMLQALRHKQWQLKMEALGYQRSQLAVGLMDSLESIEKDSGIFLIKPTVSNQHRRLLEDRHKSAHGKARPQGGCGTFVPEHSSQPTINGQNRAKSSMGPYYPNSTANQRRDQARSGASTTAGLFPARSATALHRPKTLVRSAAATWTYRAPSSSLPEAGDGGDPKVSSPTWLGTPRILEMDINRVMYSHERAAAPVPPGPAQSAAASGRRGASSATTRSYMTLSRASRLRSAASNTGSHKNIDPLGQHPVDCKTAQAAAEEPMKETRRQALVAVIGLTADDRHESTEDLASP